MEMERKRMAHRHFDKQNDVARELISWKTTKETELNDIYENIIIISKSEKSGSIESAKLGCPKKIHTPRLTAI